MSNRLLLFHILLLWLTISGYSQPDSTSVLKVHGKDEDRQQVYRTRPAINWTIITGGFVANFFGVKFLKSKPGLDSATAVSLSPADVPRFDRDAAVQNPAIAEKAMFWSDIALNSAIVLPTLLLFDREIKSDALQIGVIYLTTGAIMANAYSWGVGHINKKRPYVYNPRESIKRRTKTGSFNSFYGGHTAAAACMTFFGAKVYHDYNPGSRLTPFIFAAAVIPPVTVGYFRHRSGMHFPSDNIAGLIGGAALGVIVPHVHKRRDKKNQMTIYPSAEGVGFSMNF